VELVIYLSVNSGAEERDAKHNILLNVMRLADRLGLSFAFPTRTIVMAQSSETGQASIAKA
jgi:hypothetical protein